MENIEFRSGFATIVGRPNAGKSTLINLLMGQKIAAVSPRPQTTRRNQLAIITTESTQLILIDTPGIHKPLSKLGDAMNDWAIGTLQDVDCVLWLVDCSEKPSAEDAKVATKLKKARLSRPPILVLNKIDAIKEAQKTENRAAYHELFPEAELAEISALRGIGCKELEQRIAALLPLGPHLYDPEQITDLYEREIAADLIRESILKNLNDEVPHSIAVRIDEYKDRTEANSYISATIVLDREAHKGIVIGKSGEMVKKIGQDARREIEKMTERKIYLELRVKVIKNWRDTPEILQTLGYLRSKGN